VVKPLSSSGSRRAVSRGKDSRYALADSCWGVGEGVNFIEGQALLSPPGNGRKTLAFFLQGGISATEIGGQARFTSTP
jgi:hypothetical protein